VKPQSSQTVYQGRVNVEISDYIYENGQKVQREVVRKDDAVAIIALDQEYLYLIRQPREAVDEPELLELPAGTMDVPGESELECAQRELAEEIGKKANHWEELLWVYTSPGFTNEKVTLFKAMDLSDVDAEQDLEEKIDIVKVPLDEVEEIIDDIVDSKSLIGLLTVFSSYG